MHEVGSFRGFLKDLGMRILAALIVGAVFLGLGFAKRTDFPIISLLIETLGFFPVGFILIVLIWVSYMVYIFFID